MRSWKIVMIIGLFCCVPLLAEAATITYYYSERCPQCRVLASYWERYTAENSREHVFLSKRTDNSADNKSELFNYYMQYRNEAHTVTPTVIVSNNGENPDVLLSGLAEINRLPEILGANGAIIPEQEVAGVVAEVSKIAAASRSWLYPFTMAALADASNPCALFVFIAATSYATVFCSQRQAIIYGVTFCGTMFSVYLGAGLAGKEVINQVFGVSPWVTVLLCLGMFILAGLHIRTAIFPNSTKYSELPQRAKELLLKNAAKCVSFGGAIVSGVLCALIEMPCTGGPYVFALNIVAQMPTMTAVKWLIYYNLIFISPLLICLTILIVAPQYVSRLDVWRGEYRRWLHLAMGVLMAMAATLGIAPYI
ncbi:MAG TPA: hypothetical protein VN611_06750 [Patescibacteria group bacterium]|nr:hypothetical protein [Patescibacteria group bacterium]